MTTGEIVGTFRKKRGITLQTLADWTGVSIATLSRIENDSNDILFRNMVLVANSLNIPMDLLVKAELENTEC